MNKRVQNKVAKRRNAMKVVADATLSMINTKSPVKAEEKEKTVAELTISDVLKTPEFFKNISNIVAELATSRNNAGRMHQLKAHPIDRLIERGVWNAGDMTVLYAQVSDKKLTGYSAAERSFIKSVGTEAFNFTMKKLIEDEEARNIGDGNDNQ